MFYVGQKFLTQEKINTIPTIVKHIVSYFRREIKETVVSRFFVPYSFFYLVISAK